MGAVFCPAAEPIVAAWGLLAQSIFKVACASWGRRPLEAGRENRRYGRKASYSCRALFHDDTDGYDKRRKRVGTSANDGSTADPGNTHYGNLSGGRGRTQSHFNTLLTEGGTETPHCKTSKLLMAYTKCSQVSYRFISRAESRCFSAAPCCSKSRYHAPSRAGLSAEGERDHEYAFARSPSPVC